MLKSALLASQRCPPLRPSRPSATAVVQVAIEPVRAADYSALSKYVINNFVFYCFFNDLNVILLFFDDLNEFLMICI